MFGKPFSGNESERLKPSNAPVPVICIEQRPSQVLSVPPSAPPGDSITLKK
ncbi:MAG: hypothetical protein IPH86_17535 [bacterium]|nr:hypothetical protein [bacterium]